MKEISVAQDFLPKGASDTIAEQLMEQEIENDLRLFRYNEAAGVCRGILRGFADVLSTEQMTDMQNNLQVFTALSNSPAQTISRNGNMKIKFKT